jgi:predicted branched-subunit amino acid permease
VGLLVNARLTAYATAMAPEWRGAPLRHRALAGVMLTDATWAMARSRDSGRREFYLGAGAALFVGWPVIVALGVLAGQWVSAVPVAGLLSAMTLGAVVVPQLRERPTAAAAAVAVLTAALTTTLPTGTALVLAAVTGGGTGLLVARVTGRAR